jgi:hypothetical protein
MHAVIDRDDHRILMLEQEPGNAKRRPESEPLDFDGELQRRHQ